MTGGVVSITVTVWLQMEELLQPSVARQVRVAVKVLPQPGFVTVFATVMRFVPQTSVAIG